MNLKDTFPIIAKTSQGLEEVLANEIDKLGGIDITILRRGVKYTGNLELLYKSNICLRTALRIIIPIYTEKIQGKQDFYDAIKSIDWNDYLHWKDSLAVDSFVHSSLFTNSQFASQFAKDAIVDQIREKTGKRPFVDLKNPTLRINIHLANDFLTVSLDSSGESLHKRGYRKRQIEAPINEVLAAGMILLSGWSPGENFVDPMCGSGTIAIEAALIANNIPPGIFRKEFGFKSWSNFNTNLFYDITHPVNKNLIKVKNIYGSDRSGQAMQYALLNAEAARITGAITFKNNSFEDCDPPSGSGTVIINPPYGERMKENDLVQLYSIIGDTLKKKFSGYTAWIISSNEDALKNIGLRATKKIKLNNGPLECRFQKYEMYEGTKKKKE